MHSPRDPEPGPSNRALWAEPRTVQNGMFWLARRSGEPRDATPDKSFPQH